MVGCFQWFRKNRSTINGILITVFTSVFFNLISNEAESVFESPQIIVQDILLSNTLSGILAWISIVLLVVFNLIFKLMHTSITRKSLSNDFNEIMKQNTSESLEEAIGTGCLSWGEGKTVLFCNDIIYGWKPENIVIDEYDNNMYVFFSGEDIIKKYGVKSEYPSNEEYLSFKKSKAFQSIIRKGNNLPRVMLKGSETNYDKKNRKLLLSLARTEWSQASYIWNMFGKRKGDEINGNLLMKEYAKGISSGKNAEQYLPNSLCMHLLIESLDNKIIKTRISSNKRNDNPGTWAFSLGEQLDMEDFVDGNSFYSDFMLRWLRRAFKEEYKMDQSTYIDIVDENSFRVLSLNFEADRYNFSLLCTIRLNYTSATFEKKISPLLSIDEAIEVKAVDIKDVPVILSTYNTEKRKEYHPSSYLRLLVFYFHKLGFGRAQSNIEECVGKFKHLQ